MQFSQFLLVAPLLASIAAAAPSTFADRNGLGNDIKARDPVHIAKRCVHTFFHSACANCKKGLCKSDEIKWCEKAVEKGKPCGDKSTTIEYQGILIPAGWADSCKGCEGKPASG